MPRRARKRSNIGLYHVMLRGINRNDIFHDDMDYNKMLKILRLVSSPTESKDKVLPEGCAIHAYCLMTNHVHLLIQERNESIERTMKRIGVAYVSYYNKKYDRLGPLFQGRFRSEPVDDAGYFIKLMAYIHLNPVKACIAATPDAYRWSSWGEYMSDTFDRTQSLCDFSFPFSGLTYEQMRKAMLHNNELKSVVPFGDDIRQMDDAEAVRLATDAMPQGVGIKNVPMLPREQREAVVRNLRSLGLAPNQISRLTGVSETSVRRYVK